jgi:hypothetical protein
LTGDQDTGAAKKTARRSKKAEPSGKKQDTVETTKDQNFVNAGD